MMKVVDMKTRTEKRAEEKELVKYLRVECERLGIDVKEFIIETLKFLVNTQVKRGDSNEIS